MTTTTRAAVMWQPGQWWDVVELELDDPKAHEVLVRFEASGLCHSDDHVRTGDMPVRFPIVGGHEGAGVVEKVGPMVERVKVGDRIVCSFIPVCGTCRSCSTGAQNLCESARNARHRRPARRHLPLPQGRARTWARCAPSAPSPSARSSTSGPA